MVVGQEERSWSSLEIIMKREGRRVLLSRCSATSRDPPWQWCPKYFVWSVSAFKRLKQWSRLYKVYTSLPFWTFQCKYTGIYIYFIWGKLASGMNAVLPENWWLWQLMPNKIALYFTPINTLWKVLKVDFICTLVFIYCEQGLCSMQNCWRLFPKWFGV